MPEPYDDQNVFARILRGELPSKTVAETEHSLAFHDIRAQAPTHVLVIPKGPYRDFADFAENASEAEIVDLVRTAGRVARAEGVSAEAGGDGFRVISNAGEDGVQEVPHLHLHILGGRPLGRMLSGT